MNTNDSKFGARDGSFHKTDVEVVESLEDSIQALQAKTNGTAFRDTNTISGD